ncbi:MAG TPA: universal stress protein, partial [Tepidisphaeraceae bacterium]|nr:universal stress protein [Tepidisphaeraceae bacterium]
PLMAEATKHEITVEPISFVSRDVASDITAVARARHVDLVLMGFHKPVFGKTILGGTVHRVLNQCRTDVAIFVDRGFGTTRKILVPFMGNPHDGLAMELAGKMARHLPAQVTVLHVVEPGQTHHKLDAKAAVDQTFADPSQPAPVTFRVIEDASPVDVVLREASQFDLIVIGVAEEWGLESRLIGWRAERIVREWPGSLLIVRKYPRKHENSPINQELAETSA